MRAALHQLASTLRLQLRNRMGMIYGYIFPTIFLVSFWVLYRYEPVPLIRHLGELLTVTALGGACFGLPTTLVAERERGVWRRYRLAPVSTGSLVASTVAARYLLLLSAALLQLVLAMLIGMPLPDHPLQLWVAFTFVSFAFLGLGLVIAMLADNVPAVQALGQAIFLPMLIIGGVAVRLESLPEWAQHLSAFFPGRYAVEAVQETATGAGLPGAGFALLALLLIGAAGCVAAAKLFRWDARERFVERGGKGWLAVALGAWLLVGVMGETTGRVRVASEGAETPRPGAGPLARGPQGGGEGAGAGATDDGDASDSLPLQPGVAGRDTARAPRPAGEDEAAAQPGDEDTAADAPTSEVEDEDEPAGIAGPSEPGESPGGNAGPPAGPSAAAPDEPEWAAVTIEDIGRDIRFDQLPADGGVVTPVARPGTEPDRFIAEQIECIERWLPEWEPAGVGDPVERVRNLLYVAAAADLYQMEAIESLVPLVVFDLLQREFPRDDLVKLLYWVAMTPDEGSPPAVDQLSLVCLDAYGTVNLDELRVRTSIYAAKLLGRLVGFIVP